MAEKVRIAQIGLGPLGQKIVKYITEKNGLEIVSAVDPAPDKAGKDLDEICSVDKGKNIHISADIGLAIQTNKPDVALLTTVSSLEKLVPQVKEIAQYGIHVVSTCEELFFPWYTQPKLAEELDKIARKYGIAILGTGINPGFIMDFLPVVLTGVCQKVIRIKVLRIQDASFRRIPFQKKIGVGLTAAEFEERKKSGNLRHVGLTESMHMIAHSLGWRLGKTEDIISPIIAESKITAGGIEIDPGFVLGVQQIGKGYLDGEEVITLFLKATVGERNPVDSIEIQGVPNITSSIPGGINGDIATCAITINAIQSVIRTSPGLKTMLDIPVVSCLAS